MPAEFEQNLGQSYVLLQVPFSFLPVRKANCEKPLTQAEWDLFLSVSDNTLGSLLGLQPSEAKILKPPSLAIEAQNFAAHKFSLRELQECVDGSTGVEQRVAQKILDLKTGVRS